MTDLEFEAVCKKDTVVLKEMLKTIYERTPIGPMSGFDADFVLASLKYHKHADRKRLDAIGICMTKSSYGPKMFTAMYPDGSTDGFSYKALYVTPRTSPEHKDLRTAMRDVVSLYIPKEKGKHTHHVIEFKSLVDSFLSNRSDYVLEHLPTGGVILKDNDFKREWIDFHNANAHTVNVTQKEHKEIHKKLKEAKS